MPEKRIPELDAARGFCILCMVAVHLVYDLTELYPVLRWEYPPFFLLVKNWGGVVFFLISGIAATLGRRHLRRGLLFFGCGILISAAMELTGAMPIRFGVLHALGLSMLLWALFRKVDVRLLAAAGTLFGVLGLVFGRVTVSADWLYPVGLTAADFQSADYFPLLPYFGYFLLGACLGKRLYPDRRSLFGKTDFSKIIPRFFCFCGRHSLLLYLIHQPVLILIIEIALVSSYRRLQ